VGDGGGLRHVFSVGGGDYFGCGDEVKR
jgi:hypothetical protein